MKRQHPRDQLAEIRRLGEIERDSGLDPLQSARLVYLVEKSTARRRYRTARIARLEAELELLLDEATAESQRDLARQPRLPLIYLVRSAA